MKLWFYFDKMFNTTLILSCKTKGGRWHNKEFTVYAVLKENENFASFKILKKISYKLL